MAKKLLLNTLYTVMIVVCAIGGYEYGVNSGQPAYLVLAGVFIAIFILLKISILKEIKDAQKP